MEEVTLKSLRRENRLMHEMLEKAEEAISQLEEEKTALVEDLALYKAISKAGTEEIQSLKQSKLDERKVWEDRALILRDALRSMLKLMRPFAAISKWTKDHGWKVTCSDGLITVGSTTITREDLARIEAIVAVLDTQTRGVVQ